MRLNTPLVLVALLLSYCATASSATVPDIGIGGDESDAHTHLRFDGIPKDSRIINVNTHLIVDRAGPVGLNLFAVQVNFPNQTRAHGGRQVNSGEEKANWVGLVNRGGGSTSRQQHTKWSLPTYRTEDGDADKVPTGWQRF
jgi:hypothetical protein